MSRNKKIPPLQREEGQALRGARIEVSANVREDSEPTEAHGIRGMIARVEELDADSESGVVR